MTNALYYGDNLDVLRESIASESVDLIYLDPPFNSNASYNVLFKSSSGEQSAAQIEAFGDSWHWTTEGSERAYDDVMSGKNSDVSTMLRAMRLALGDNDMMAYLAMMAVRLIELHRVLKPTGSLYLHCDPTASHYLKLLLDGIFGPKRFLNEITWKRTSAHNDGARYGRIQDRILFYSKSAVRTFKHIGGEYSPEQLARFRYKENDRRYKAENLTAPHYSETRTVPWRGTHPGDDRQWRFGIDELERLWKDGRILQRRDGCPRKDGLKEYLDKCETPALQDLWTDIDRIGNTSSERMHYQTQKPVALLERIISCSSNASDVVLDPFCGCGTTIHAAQKLGRPWIGIDVTHLAIGLVELRLKSAFPAIAFEVYGVPTDLAGASNLAQRDKHEFQKWITGRIGAQPYKGGKKGMDRGVDGFLHFRDGAQKSQVAIVSVKGGGTKSGDVRDLKGTVEREKAVMGLFLTLNEPTREMEREAASAGFYETGGMKFPRIQILTAAQILDGRRPQVPFGFTEGFKKAAREKQDAQTTLF